MTDGIARCAGIAVVSVVVFLCTRCFATWRVLPAFMARCLWRTWEVVEASLFEGERAVAACLADAIMTNLTALQNAIDRYRSYVLNADARRRYAPQRPF